MQEEIVERSGIQRVTQRQQRNQMYANGEMENLTWDFESMAKTVMSWEASSNEENMHPNITSGINRGSKGKGGKEQVKMIR